MAGSTSSSLLGMDREELAALVSESSEPSYRAQQIMQAVYRDRVETLGEISTLPVEFRGRLEQRGVTVGAARIENKFVSQDGTVRYLIAFADGESVETVWMPEGDGGEAGDGSEAGVEAETSVEINAGAKAGCEKDEPSAALARRASQNRKPPNETAKDRAAGNHTRQNRVAASMPVGRRFAYPARWDAPSTASSV